MSSARTTALRPYEHFAWRSLIGLVVIIAGATGFGLLLLLVRGGWPPLVSFDRNAVDTLNHAVAGDRIAVTVLTAVTNLGGRTILFWLVTVSTAVMLIRRQYQLTAYLVVTGLGALALDPAIKAMVGRLRPMVPAPVATAPGYSFPSGHVLDATVFYGVMLLVFLPIIPGRLRKLAMGLVIALVVAIGFSRVAIGVHYPSDVIGGWLLGVAWLGVTAHAFGHWRAETGQPPRHLSQGLAPEAAPQLGPTRIVPVAHPWLIATRLVVSFVLIGGALFGLGKLITAHAPAFDEAVPRWLASQRTPQLDTLSNYPSQAGNTHWILAVGLVIVPLALALIRRWRPAVFVAVVMLGELGLFVSVAAIVHRARPEVTHLDGHLPTSAFPSGHTAATLCLYGALAVLVVPRPFPTYSRRMTRPGGGSWSARSASTPSSSTRAACCPTPNWPAASSCGSGSATRERQPSATETCTHDQATGASRIARRRHEQLTGRIATRGGIRRRSRWPGAGAGRGWQPQGPDAAEAPRGGTAGPALRRPDRRRAVGRGRRTAGRAGTGRGHAGQQAARRARAGGDPRRQGRVPAGG